MKAYLITTGTVFAFILVAHTLEMFDRGRMLAEDVPVLALSAGLGVWAWWLVRRAGR